MIDVGLVVLACCVPFAERLPSPCEAGLRSMVLLALWPLANTGQIHARSSHQRRLWDYASPCAKPYMNFIRLESGHTLEHNQKFSGRSPQGFRRTCSCGGFGRPMTEERRTLYMFF